MTTTKPRPYRPDSRERLAMIAAEAIRKGHPVRRAPFDRRDVGRDARTTRLSGGQKRGAE